MTVPQQSSLPRPRVAQIDSMADFQQCIVENGVPEEARKMVLASWRPSTIRVYCAQYRVYKRWCSEFNKDPTKASVEDVLKFLQHLFDKGLQYRTLCVYRSMLSNILPAVQGVKVGELPQVIRFLKGVFNSRPPKRILLPEWDLPLVLEVLSQSPFEPMKSAPLKLVMYKFSFLLALTTARRVSDLSKLAIGDHCRIQRGRVTFLPTSLAKADDPSHFQQEIIIERFKKKTLCPLRAMKWYLKRTDDRRQQEQRPLALLLCLNPPYQPPSSQTVSRWLVQTIKLAYEIYPHLQGTIKAHSVRAIAPNWAHFQGASKQAILQAADWRRESTFIKHYQRDLAGRGNSFGTAVLSASSMD